MISALMRIACSWPSTKRRSFSRAFLTSNTGSSSTKTCRHLVEHQLHRKLHVVLDVLGLPSCLASSSNPTLARNIVCSRAIVDSLRTRSTGRQPRYVTLRCLRRCSFRAQLIDRTGCGLTQPLGETSGLDRTQNTHMAQMPDGSGYGSLSSRTTEHRESSHEQRTRTSKRA